MPRRQIGDCYVKTVKCRSCKDPIEVEIEVEDGGDGELIYAEQGDYFCYACDAYVCDGCRAEMPEDWAELGKTVKVDVEDLPSDKYLESLQDIVDHNGDWCEKCVANWELQIIKTIPKESLPLLINFKWATKKGAEAFKSASVDTRISF